MIISFMQLRTNKEESLLWNMIKVQMRLAVKHWYKFENALVSCTNDFMLEIQPYQIWVAQNDCHIYVYLCIFP